MKLITFVCDRESCDNTRTEYISKHNSTERHYCSAKCFRLHKTEMRMGRLKTVKAKKTDRQLFLEKWNRPEIQQRLWAC